MMAVQLEAGDTGVDIEGAFHQAEQSSTVGNSIQAGFSITLKS